MDFFGELFGMNPATPEERNAQREKAMRETKFDYVLKDGKVYLGTDQLAGLYRQVGRLLYLRGMLTDDVVAAGGAHGMGVAAGIVEDAASELLRREADAILKAQD